MNKRVRNVLAVAAAVIMILQSMSGMVFAAEVRCKVTGTVHEVSGAAAVTGDEACPTLGATHIFKNYVDGGSGLKTYTRGTTTGTNYYYVPIVAGMDVKIIGGPGKDIIYLSGSVANGKITIYNFSAAEDEIIISNSQPLNITADALTDDGIVKIEAGSNVLQLSAATNADEANPSFVAKTTLIDHLNAKITTTMQLLAASQPADATVVQGTPATALTFGVYSFNGTPQYQWYSNTTNTTTGGTSISGATLASYTPPVGTVGTMYYYCVASGTGYTSVTSQAAKVVVNPAPQSCNITATLDIVTANPDTTTMTGSDTTITVSVPVKYLGTCTDTSHNPTNHGGAYTVEWTSSVTADIASPTSTPNADNLTGFTSSTTITVPKTSLAEGSNTVTFTATLKKGGTAVGGTGGTAFTTVTITTPVTPTCPVTATLNPTITPSENSLTVSGSGTNVTFSVPVTFDFHGGTCGINGHAASYHGYKVDWAIAGSSGSSITPTITVTGSTSSGFTSNALVTVKSTDIVGGSGTVTATATLKKDSIEVPGATASTFINVTSSQYCTYPIDSGRVIGPGANTGTVVFNVIKQPVSGTFTLTDLDYKASGYQCNIHTGADHKKTCGWKLMSAATGGAELGVNDGYTLVSAGDNKVTLTVDKSKLSGVNRTVYLIATSNGSNVNFACLPIQINACKSDYGSVSIANPSQIPTRDVTTTNTFKLDDFLTGKPAATTCGIADHRHVTWTILTNVSGCASVNAAGELVVDKALLPAAGGQIKLKYVTDGAETTPTDGTLFINLTRSQICTKTVASISGSTAITARNATTTQNYSAVWTGTCEKGHDHSTVTWSMTASPTLASGYTSGINSGSGLLTLRKSELTSDKYTLTIKAEFVGTTGSKESKTTTVTVTKGAASSGSTGSNNSQEWSDIEDDISDAKSGSTIRRSLGSNSDLPYYVWDTLRGKNVNLEMIFGKYTWTVNGKTVKKLPDYQIYLPMGVKEISNSDIAKLARGYDVTILELEHEGSYYADMKLTFYAGYEYAGKTLYLYYYNSSTNKLTYRTSAKANSDGDVTFPFTSASTYLVTSYALYGESTTTSGSGTISSGSSTAGSSSSPNTSSSSSSSSSDSSSSSSSSESSSSSSSSLSSSPASTPTNANADPAEKKSIPLLVPILLVAIAAVIVAILLISKKRREY